MKKVGREFFKRGSIEEIICIKVTVKKLVTKLYMLFRFSLVDTDQSKAFIYMYIWQDIIAFSFIL